MEGIKSSAEERVADMHSRLEDRQHRLADERSALQVKIDEAIGPAASFQKQQADLVEKLVAELNQLR